MLRSFTKQNMNESHTLVAARPTLVPTQVALAITLAAIAAFWCGPAAFGQCQYEVTAILDIGDCDIGDSHTFGQGMNDNADVVGFYRFCAVGNERAFFWSQDTGFITLPHPPGVVRSWAYDISDNRIIVGQHEFTGIGRMGFVYDMNKNNGEYQHLEPLHEGATAMNISSANAVNNAGVVAGMRIIGKSGNTPHNAVIWRPFEKGSPVEDLGVMNGPNSAVRDINEAEVAAGWDGFSPPTTTAQAWDGRKTIDFGPIPGGDTSWSFHVNAHKVATGTGMNLSDLTGRAFLWHDGEFTVIPPPAEFTTSTGGAINDVGQFLITNTVRWPTNGGHRDNSSYFVTADARPRVFNCTFFSSTSAAVHLRGESFIVFDRCCFQSPMPEPLRADESATVHCVGK